jgi:hypothetical protein
LKKFGFGDVFIKWIMIFYNKINSTVKCNGFLTKYFSIENDIRQGCPISALLYVLAAEPLQCSISDFCLFIFAPELASYFSKTLKISPTDSLFDTVKVVSSAC